MSPGSCRPNPTSHTGLTLEALHEAAKGLAESEVVGSRSGSSRRPAARRRRLRMRGSRNFGGTVGAFKLCQQLAEKAVEGAPLGVGQGA